MTMFRSRRKDAASNRNKSKTTTSGGGGHFQTEVKELKAGIDELQRRLATLTAIEDGGGGGGGGGSGRGGGYHHHERGSGETASTAQSSTKSSYRDLEFLPPQQFLEEQSEEKRRMIPPPSFPIFDMDNDSESSPVDFPLPQKKYRYVRTPDISRKASVGPEVLSQLRNSSNQSRLKSTTRRTTRRTRPSEKPYGRSVNDRPIPPPPPYHPSSKQKNLQRGGPPSKIIVPNEVTNSVASSENSLQKQKRNKGNWMVSTQTKLRVDEMLQQKEQNQSTHSFASTISSPLSSASSRKGLQQHQQQHHCYTSPPSSKRMSKTATRKATKDGYLNNQTNETIKRIQVLPTHAEAAAVVAKSKSSKEKKHRLTAMFRTSKKPSTSHSNQRAMDITLPSRTPSVDSEELLQNTDKPRRIVKARQIHHSNGVVERVIVQSEVSHQTSSGKNSTPGMSQAMIQDQLRSLKKTSSTPRSKPSRSSEENHEVPSQALLKQRSPLRKWGKHAAKMEDSAKPTAPSPKHVANVGVKVQTQKTSPTYPSSQKVGQHQLRKCHSKPTNPNSSSVVVVAAKEASSSSDERKRIVRGDIREKISKPKNKKLKPVTVANTAPCSSSSSSSSSSSGPSAAMKGIARANLLDEISKSKNKKLKPVIVANAGPSSFASSDPSGAKKGIAQANLMEEISKSKNKRLKPVNVTEEETSASAPAPTPVKPPRTMNTHDNLMAGIRAGVNLKKVPDTEKAASQSGGSKSSSGPPPNSLLAKLQARKQECLKRQRQQQQQGNAILEGRNDSDDDDDDW